MGSKDYNCFNNLTEVIEIFEDLKMEGYSKQEAEDCLEFESDEYPNIENIKKGLDVVFGI